MENTNSTGEMSQTQQQEVVLVTGGSGFLGQHIVRELQLHDPRVKEIRVLDLVPYQNHLGHEESKPVLSFTGDITDLESCRAAFRGAHCVIHAAALVSYAYPADEESLERVNVQGTRHVVQLCLEEGVARLVHVGTAEVAMRPRFLGRIYPLIVAQNEVRAMPVTEDCGMPAYVMSKLRAERVVLEADMAQLLVDGASGETTGHLRTVVLRPSPLYGELDSRNLPAALRLASLTCGHLVCPTGYGGRQQFVYAGNVAWATVLAKDALGDPMKVETAAGVPMFITDDTCVDHAYVLAEKIAGKRATVSELWLPVLLTYPLSMLAEKVAVLVNKPLPVQLTAVLSFLGGVINFSRLRANIHLHYMPRYSEREALELTKRHLAASDGHQHQE